MASFSTHSGWCAGERTLAVEAVTSDIGSYRALGTIAAYDYCQR
jgi:hypothetical protein